MTAAARIVERWPASMMMTADARVEYLPSAGAEDRSRQSAVGLALTHSRVLVLALPILCGGAALVSLLFFVFLSGCASKSHICVFFVHKRTCNGFDSIHHVYVLHAARFP